MPGFTFLPVGDYRNEGWSLVGSAVTKLFEALNNDDDTKYIVAPASKAVASVTFPVDTTSVPEGAVIVSVTVKARVAIGSGSAPAGSAPSVTFSVAAQDDTSRYTTRTIYPTSSSPQTFDVATYTRDALGNPWDVFRLNYLFCKVFTFLGISDLCRVYKLFLDIKYRTRPTVAVTSPSGTVTTASPVVSWTYTQTDGDPQHHAEIRVFTADQVAQVGFNPSFDSPVYATRVEGDIRSFTLPTSLNSNSYWVYVRAHSSFQAMSVWSGRQFSVSAPQPGIPGLEDPEGGDPFIEVVHDVETGSASLTLRDTSNMLSAQEADAESSVDGATFMTTNATVARDTTKAFPGGTSSWKMTAAGAGDMTLFSDWQEVMPGQPITGMAQLISASASRNYRVRVLFYDSSFTLISGTLTGSNQASSTGTWVNPTVSGTAAPGATYLRLAVDILSASASEVHNVDRLGVMYGTNVRWSDGGQMSRNLLSSWYSTAEGTPMAGESWTGASGTTATTDTTAGTGASGTTRNKMTYVGLSPSIAFRAAGTAFNSATNGVDFTLNKPAGVVSGDLMLAFVTSSEYSTISPPSGWSLVDTARVEDGTRDTAMFVLKRTAGGAEPASWTDGTVSVTAARRTAIVMAYSGAADATSQPLTSTTATTGNPTPLWLTTPTLNNTDPNSWRISAFAVSDNASGGTMTANRQQPSTVPGIAYVGKGTAWGDLGSSYTIYKPSGVQSGDLMIGVIGVAGDATTVNVPAGWTLLSREVANAGSSSNGYTQAIIYKFAGSSEPSSWSSSVSGSLGNAGVGTGSFAYRNVNTTTPFIAWETNQKTNSTSITTDTVNNTNSSAWRISAFGVRNTVLGTSMSSNESVERADVWGGYDGGLFGTDDNLTAGWYDSNGPVSTGNWSRTGTASNSWKGASSFIALLNPLASPPASVADETARGVATAGSADPWLTTRVFDSNGVVPTGLQSITGLWAPGSGTDMNSMVGWQGLLIPAAQVTAGFASATMASAVDISAVDNTRVDTSKVTVTAAFLGSTAGAAYLQCNFYRANQLLAQKTAQAGSFETSVWQKSVATFDVPEGTTRMTVTVSASERSVSDIVYWDRVSLAFGEDPTYRAGTSRETHPVWSRPEIQYADDFGTGYGDYKALPGSSVRPPAYEQLSGDAYYTDHTPIPLTNRIYRARSETFGLAGDVFVSDWGPQSAEYNFVARNWWLKDLSNPDNNIRLNVAWDSFTVTTANTATVFQPLGEELPVVLTEGYKGDSFSVDLIPVNHDDWFALLAALKSGRTLFLQTDIDHAWLVRPVGDLNQTVLATGKRKENPQRRITINFIQVAE